MQNRHERQARNEALLREVNERIEGIGQATQEAGLGEDATFEFLCECGQGNGADITCDEHFEMTLAEYEEVRSQDDRFALVPGHESSTRSRKLNGLSRTILATPLHTSLANRTFAPVAPRQLR